MKILEFAAPVSTQLTNFEAEFEGQLYSNVPLADLVVHYVAGKKGKRLRPLIVFLAAKLHGDLMQKTMDAAVVVEMFHTATLVHDDVVDESHLRRGSPTVNDVWDNKISILVGDFLFSKTLTSIVKLKNNQALEILSDAAEEITEGELLQIAYSRETELSEDQYFKLIAKKTAALFSASCQLGALTTGGDDDAVQRMYDFGYHFGIAFQIADDLLDYLGNETTLGKPTGNDIKEGKITLPLIYALHNCDESKRQDIIERIKQRPVRDEDVDTIVNFTKQMGGVEYSKKLAVQYAEQALQILKQYPESDAQQSLSQLIRFAIDRNN